MVDGHDAITGIEDTLRCTPNKYLKSTNKKNIKFRKFIAQMKW